MLLSKFPYKLTWKTRINACQNAIWSDIFQAIYKKKKLALLSDQMWVGAPPIVENLLSEARKTSVIMSATRSKCIALTTKQLKCKIYTFFTVGSWHYLTGPVKSTPMVEKGLAGVTRDDGSSPILCWTTLVYVLRQVMHFLLRPFMVLVWGCGISMRALPSQSMFLHVE